MSVRSSRSQWVTGTAQDVVITELSEVIEKNSAVQPRRLCEC